MFLEMKLIKIHRVLKLIQSDWMKKYIDFNTEERKNATNYLDKDFFKWAINSFYRKNYGKFKKKSQREICK